MADENTNTDSDPSSDEVALDLGSETKQDDVFEKHIDIAIEAQDGKAETKSGEAEGAAESGEAKDAAGKGGDGDGKDAAAQSKPDKEGAEDKGASRGPKDLVLKGQGPDGSDLVIKGGAERRFYERAKVEAQRAQHLENQNRQLQEQIVNVQRELQTTRDSVENVQGLAPEQLGIAVNIYRDLQRDPAGTLQKLLAEAVASGYKIEGIASGVDAAAIERMIERRLGATLNQQDGVSEEQIIAEATRTANEFFTQYPDARLHEPLIAKVLHDNPGVDPYTAYFQLKAGFAERGFDWSRPLEEQLKEKAAQTSDASAPHQQQTEQQQQQSGPGLPGSRPAVPAATTADKSSVVAHESTSEDDIIKEAMREAGLNI